MKTEVIQETGITRWDRSWPDQPCVPSLLPLIMAPHSLMVPSHTGMHPWEHGQVLWQFPTLIWELLSISLCFPAILKNGSQSFWSVELWACPLVCRCALPRKSELGRIGVRDAPVRALKTIIQWTAKRSDQCKGQLQPKPLHWKPSSPLHIFHTNNKLLSPLLAFELLVSCWPHNLHSCGFPALSWNRLECLNGSLSEVTVVKWDQPADSY